MHVTFPSFISVFWKAPILHQNLSHAFFNPWILTTTHTTALSSHQSSVLVLYSPMDLVNTALLCQPSHQSFLGTKCECENVCWSIIWFYNKVFLDKTAAMCKCANPWWFNTPTNNICTHLTWHMAHGGSAASVWQAEWIEIWRRTHRVRGCLSSRVSSCSISSSQSHCSD